MNKHYSNTGLYGSQNSFGPGMHTVQTYSSNRHLGYEDDIPLTKRPGYPNSLTSSRYEESDEFYSSPPPRISHMNPFSTSQDAPPLPPKDYRGFNQYSVEHPEQDFIFDSDPNDPFSSTRDPVLPLPPPSQYYGGDAPGVKNGRNRMQRLKNVRWSKQPWFVWIVSLIQIAVFIAELIKMGILTGTPIQKQPTFNPMIGPSSYLLINMGARFTPCMHEIPGITDTTSNLNFPCPNSTTTDTFVCGLSELCGMGGVSNPPDQWWRFITPIFLHAGFIHIGFNLLLQIRLGSDMEKDIGHIRFSIVYMASGIAGFILGGNFAPDGIASTGASGSLFGIISLDLLDLLFNWSLYESPKRYLLMHIIEIIVSFAIGLLPGLDNFSHIGGFAMGLMIGVALLRSPLALRKLQKHLQRNDIDDEDTYEIQPSQSSLPKKSNRLHVSSVNWKHPKKNFEGRSKWWYVWLLVRVCAIVLAIVYFVELIKQFENGGGHCTWCKYLSCLPVNGWCDVGNITTTTTN